MTRRSTRFRMLSVDPGLAATGYAVIDMPERDVLDYGVIRLDAGSRGAPLNDRICAILNMVNGLAHQFCPSQDEPPRHPILVVEFPRKHAQGVHGGHVVDHQVNYGVLVGAIAFGLRAPMDGPPWGVAVIGADVWSRSVPSTRDDPHKTRRVIYAETLYGLEEGSLGARSTAGNIADALLMADYVRERIDSIELSYGKFQGPHPGKGPAEDDPTPPA